MALQKLAAAKLLSRRRAMKGALAGVLAATPFLGQVPGVSAASLGMDQPGVKVLALTGKLLRLEEQRLRSTPGFTQIEEFLKQRGLTLSDPLLEGYYLYRQTGQHWEQETILSLSYIQPSGSQQDVTVTYSRKDQKYSLDIVLADRQRQVGEGYIVSSNGQVELAARLHAQGNKQILQVAQQYEQGLLSPAVDPASSIQCNLCRAVCSGVVGTGCSILGAAFTCGEICLPLGENPLCFSLCAVAYRLVCSIAGTFDCVQLVCVNAFHVC
jgi:hypothetical protein